MEREERQEEPAQFRFLFHSHLLRKLCQPLQGMPVLVQVVIQQQLNS